MFLTALKFSVSVVLTCYYFSGKKNNELEWRCGRGHTDKGHHEKVMSDFPHLHHVDGIKHPHSNNSVNSVNFGHSQHQFCQFASCSSPVSIRIYSGVLVS